MRSSKLQPAAPAPPVPCGGDIFALAFGAAVCMWAVGYIARMPPAVVPAWALLAVLVAIQIAAGAILGRFTARRWPAAAATGALMACINLLVLGSLIAEGHTAIEALIAVAAFIAISAVLCLVGYSITKRRSGSADIHWTGVLAMVAVAGTIVLIIAGGLVTGWEAGLAVPDWPNTEGALMFLYPLSRMTGGVYYEHAHRLYGALVGLTTVVLCVHIWWVTARRSAPGGPATTIPRWVRWIALLAVVLVIAQGIMGGLRVTGRLTTEVDRAALEPNVELAIVHGVTAQVFLGLMTAIAVFVSRTWILNREPSTSSGAGVDRALAIAAASALLIQLILGATYRHLNAQPDSGDGVMHVLFAHMGFATIVLALFLLAGWRSGTRYRDIAAIRRSGRWLTHAVGLQVLLGVCAFAAITVRGDRADIPAWEVWITTAHQATGAILMALIVMHLLWTRRLIAPA